MCYFSTVTLNGHVLTPKHWDLTTRKTCMWLKLATSINTPIGRQQKKILLTGCLAVENCHIFEQHQLSHFIYEMTAEQKLSLFFHFDRKT